MRITFLIFCFIFTYGTIAAPSADSSTRNDTTPSDPTQKITESSDTTTTLDTLTTSSSSVTDTTVVPSSSAKDTSIPTDTAIDAPTGQKTQGPIIEEIDEELILDGGEESILAPVVSESPPQSHPHSVDSSLSQHGSDSIAADSSIVSNDSLQKQHKKMLSHYPAEAKPKIDEPVKPLAIEKTRSINFAKNFKEYRSPKVAILLSLLVPGVGQAYSHHSLKAAIFGFVEASFITAGAIVAYQGNKRMNTARSFADKHYSVDSLDRYRNLFYAKDTLYDSIIFYNFSKYSDFKREASKKSQSYYNLISRQVSPYIQGWKDVTPRFDNNFDPVDTSDNGNYIANEDPDSLFFVYFVDNNGTIDTAVQYGLSKNQREFSSLLSNANLYFRWSKGLFSMLLINHIVSAVDAGITAKAYNDKLLGKTSFWQKINIRNNSVGTFSGTAQGYALEVRF